MGEGERGRLARALEDDGEAPFDLEERLGLQAAAARGIVFEVDLTGHFLNAWTGEAKGSLPERQLVGRSLHEVFDGPTCASLMASLQRVITTERPETFEVQVELRTGMRTLVCESKPSRASDGQTRTVLTIVRDVTAPQTLDGRLHRAERLASLGLVGASIGHEIRQPLAILSTNIETLERELGPEATARVGACLARIHDSARRIGSIVSSFDVLTPKPTRRSERFDVRRSIEAAVDLSKSLVEERARFDLRITPVPEIVGNEDELCQVLLNLIMNSAQAIPPGAPREHEIAIATTVVGELVRVTVRDTGTGIDASVRDRICEPFFTTKASEGGTGLGLYITSRIVELHNGKLTVESGSRGTTVHVDLPNAVGPARPKTFLRLKAPRPRLAVLVVDDEPRILESLRLVLDGVHDVTASARSSHALELVREDPTRFDAILCDLTMGELDGIAFFDEMVKLGVGDRVVVMTGGARTARASTFLEARRCPVIEKPFMFDELLRALDDVVGHASKDT